jgi:hypothetical protein
LLGGLHETLRHSREGFEAGRIDRLPSKERLLSELIVESQSYPHGLAYGEVYFLVKLELRFRLPPRFSLDDPQSPPVIQSGGRQRGQLSYGPDFIIVFIAV